RARLAVAGADQRLRGQMEDDLRPGRLDQRCNRRRIANIAKFAVTKHGSGRLREKIGDRRRRQADARYARPQPMQPERKPRTFETAVAREQDTLAAPERHRWRARQCQIFHGALPDDQSSSNMLLSRSVSIACQKPRCSNAIIWPMAARRTMGELSQLTSSLSMKSRQRGESTKKPPLIMPPSPG